MSDSSDMVKGVDNDEMNSAPYKGGNIPALLLSYAKC